MSLYQCIPFITLLYVFRDFIFYINLSVLITSESNQVAPRISLSIVYFLIDAVFLSIFPVNTPLATVILVQSLLSTYSTDDKVSLWL